MSTDAPEAANESPPTRILVYGVTGSGKTTLAKRIAEKTGLPWYSVDDLTWRPGWVEVPTEEQRECFTRICAQPRWILDTAYGKWRDIPLARTQLIVALDYPRVLSFWRLLRRSILRAIDKKPICNGNQESFRLMLSKDSILAWHFKSYRSKHQRISDWDSNPGGPPIVRLRHPRETERWLQTLRPVDSESPV